MRLHFYFIYCKAATSKEGKKRKQKSPRAQAVLKDSRLRSIFHQAQASHLAPVPGGFDLWGGTGRGFIASRVGKALHAGPRVLPAQCFCGFGTQAQPPPDQTERHFPNPALSPGGGPRAGCWRERSALPLPPFWGA